MPPRKNGADEALPPTFIIRKKHSDDDGGHHGGVWKIAYADFMTAMMTFFLVMWLINTASKEKITKLASYFNPVKLTDRNPGKGVRDNDPGGVSEVQAAPAAAAEKTPEKPDKKADEVKKTGDDKKPDAEKRPAQDEALFSNPFGVLTRLASQAESAIAAQGGQASAAGRGASHDPFVTDPVQSQPLSALTSSSTPVIAYFSTRPADAKAKGSAADEKRAAGAGGAGGAAQAQAQQGDQPSDKSKEVASQLGRELTRLMEQLPRSFRPNISTKATNEGVLVSLTDDINFSMFRIASAEPSPQLVLVLERIGALINKHPGKLVVRGHTDARQYAADTHGNWRLSVNRANMAYFMLLRAKVEDGRFLAVEGYADRNLRNKADPLAAENRRIEILIKGAES